MATGQQKCKLAPIDLLNEDQLNILEVQRKICGWNYKRSVFSQWHEAVVAGEKSMFWIVKPSTEEGSKDELRVGHIAIDSKTANSEDTDLANPDGSVLEITNVFVLPEHRGGGIARAAFEEAERLAIKEPYGSPKCKYVALTTFTGRFLYKDSEDKAEHDYFSNPRAETANMTMNIPWYERMGYEVFRTAPRWPYNLKDGTDIIAVAAFLRKPVSKISGS
jgi:ribosomal protein S18 acetylase RimI-like enzyme